MGPIPSNPPPIDDEIQKLTPVSPDGTLMVSIGSGAGQKNKVLSFSGAIFFALLNGMPCRFCRR